MRPFRANLGHHLAEQQNMGCRMRNSRNTRKSAGARLSFHEVSRTSTLPLHRREAPALQLRAVERAGRTGRIDEAKRFADQVVQKRRVASGCSLRCRKRVPTLGCKVRKSRSATMLGASPQGHHVVHLLVGELGGSGVIASSLQSSRDTASCTSAAFGVPAPRRSISLRDTWHSVGMILERKESNSEHRGEPGDSLVSMEWATPRHCRLDVTT